LVIFFSIINYFSNLLHSFKNRSGHPLPNKGEWRAGHSKGILTVYTHAAHINAANALIAKAARSTLLIVSRGEEADSSKIECSPKHWVLPYFHTI
jgi:malonyl CoA-acyl carrier protein transacylase